MIPVSCSDIYQCRSLSRNVRLCGNYSTCVLSTDRTSFLINLETLIVLSSPDCLSSASCIHEYPAVESDGIPLMELK